MEDHVATPVTLCDWAGGVEAIGRLIGAFYDRVETIDVFDPVFPGGVSPAHREAVTAWWVEVFGGPSRYTQEYGGYPNMVRHHRNLQITAEQRATFVSTMSLAADDAALPADPEFRSALLAYVEWGTRLALANSQLGATPPPRAPVPRWGWGEAPPYQP
ncbi:MAG TPA: group II truncated hemoglobin [Ornithinimicrobium sp.]|uniref:group II truncated hemoglobin n=1 Tax=Ornithinimicrobium sp. TaxID=1977084 RepID=UPI002B474B2A|nr:group II truncated hemoglobin [Ornithinimicrobium sp.]HKJ12675.1 group II truncated hemoglobin [Ornithinimicrobium sp.]